MSFDQTPPPIPNPESAAFTTKAAPPSPLLSETQFSQPRGTAIPVENASFISVPPAPYGTLAARQTTGDQTRGQEVHPHGHAKLSLADLPGGVQVAVRFSDQGASPYEFTQGSDGIMRPVVAPKPDIVIGKDGSVKHLTDLSHGVHENIVVEVEKVPGHQHGTTAQQHALNAYLKNELPGVLQNNSETAAIAQQNVQLTDNSNLVKSDTRRKLSEVATAPGPDLPQETQINIANLEQALPRNMQSGMMSGERAHSFYPDIKQQVNDSDDMYADKKMLGGLYSDKRHPYEHIATRNNGSYMVGGYGATFNSFSHYASLGLTPEVLEKLGHPPNWSQLGAVVKNLRDTDPQAYDDYLKNVTAAQQAGKIDADLAKRLLPGADGKLDDIDHFGRFVAKLQGHRGHITTAELRQNMSSTTQEAMATALVKEYKGMGADASKIALAVGLDKTPDELTAADISGAKARSLRSSSRKFYHLARASQHAGKDDAIAIHATGEPGSLSYKLANAFMKHARSSTPGGWCAGHLADALAAVGLGKWRNDATPMAHSMLASGEWVAINPDKAAPGDVVYRPHATGHGGHIEGVVAINSHGVELASDFHHTLANIRDNNNGYYSGLTVMRYVGKNGAKDLSKTENA